MYGLGQRYIFFQLIRQDYPWNVVNYGRSFATCMQNGRFCIQVALKTSIRMQNRRFCIPILIPDAPGLLFCGLHRGVDVGDVFVVFQKADKFLES